MNTRKRYYLSLLIGSLFQVLGMAFLVIFMKDAIHATANIPATFALVSLYCQIFATAFYFIADHLNK